MTQRSPARTDAPRGASAALRLSLKIEILSVFSADEMRSDGGETQAAIRMLRALEEAAAAPDRCRRPAAVAYAATATLRRTWS